MKKTLSLALAVILLLAAAAGCSSSGSAQQTATSTAQQSSTQQSSTQSATQTSTEPQYVLKLGHNSPQDSMYNKGADKFAELVSQYTNGAVKVEVHNSGTLGDEAELLDGVRLGTVDMAVINSSQLASFSSKFSVLSLPYLFSDYDHVARVVASDVGKTLVDSALQDANVRILLPFWSDGFRNFVNNVREVKTPEDLAGLKLRVPGWEALIAATSEFGANPVNMPFSEAYTAITNKTVDGMEGVPWSILANKVNEICKYMTLDGHVYSPSVLIVNVKMYDGLPDDLKAAIDKAASEAGQYQTDMVKESEITDVETLKSQGMTVTEVDKAVWEAAAQPVYEQYKDKLDQDLIKAIQDLK